jgi:hypothetical protein
VWRPRLNGAIILKSILNQAPGKRGDRSEGIKIPALIAKFKSTGTPVPLQCHPEVVPPGGHAVLPR